MIRKNSCIQYCFYLFVLLNCCGSFIIYVVCGLSFNVNLCCSESNDNDADKSTGRAIDDNHGFPFPLKDISFPSTSKASNHRYSNSKPNVVYAASPVSRKSDLFRNSIVNQKNCLIHQSVLCSIPLTRYSFIEIAQDRFVPRESVSYFIQKNSNRVKSSAPKRNPNECEFQIM